LSVLALRFNAWFRRAVAKHVELAAEMHPEMPAGVEDRQADAWEPLLVVADLAGGECRGLRARLPWHWWPLPETRRPAFTFACSVICVSCSSSDWQAA
jgi:hypothetical protein